MNNKCLYFHINPIKQEIFYVGIGNIGRPYSKSGRDRNSHWCKIVKKYDYQIILIHKNISLKKAYELEIKYIKEIGRFDKNSGPLVNHTDGGEGGDTFSYNQNREIIREKHRINSKRIWKSKRLREQVSNKMKGVNIGPKNGMFGKIGKSNPTYGSKNGMFGKPAPNRRLVYQFNKSGKLIDTFISIKNASISTKICANSINRCALGKLPHAGNFIWKYTEH